MAHTIKILTVTDLHRLRGLFFEFTETVSREKPDALCLVGDFLDFCGTTEPQLTTAEAALSIARLEVPEIIFVRGNHEDSSWFEFQDVWNTTGRRLVASHGEACTVGPATFVGFPCLMGDDTAFVGERPSLPASPSSWLSRLLESHGPSIRTL